MADRTTGARRGATGPARAASTPDARTAKGGKDVKPPKPRWQRRLVATLKVLAIGVLVVALLGIGVVAVAYQRTNFPDPNAAFMTNKSNVYYNDGTTVLGSFAEQNRTSIAYSEMPQSIKDAVVAAENRGFWTDKGISPTGIVRSLYEIARGRSLQGASTITQQYIKILYLTSDQTATRKFTEVLLAIKMGRSMPKEQILGATSTRSTSVAARTGSRPRRGRTSTSTRRTSPCSSRRRWARSSTTPACTTRLTARRTWRG